MALISNHPEKNIIRVQLTQTAILKDMTPSELADLEPYLAVEDYVKGDCLLHQGDRDLDVIFVLDGILKRAVANQNAKEMILRFTSERNMEATYASWRLNRSAPFSLYAVTKTRVAKLPLPQWVAFIESYPKIKQRFEMEVLNIMSSIMAHTITLHLLDAPGRVHRFLRKHPELYDRMPKKELASYLNLSAETLSRLKNQGKI
ncbi:MAG: Crp/Fnr family transcriptional regulator [Oxalobacter sp.]|jgi:CRP-like cAMP-binding protein|nr:MAG: Crp/Fnr family transcriptional regulator [Oxalobacter sp.]